MRALRVFCTIRVRVASRGFWFVLLLYVSQSRDLVTPWFLQWSTFILKQPSHKLCKRHFCDASVLLIKVHFDIQKLTIKFDIAFAVFASRLSRLHTCVFGHCDLNQHSHESCTSSLSNLRLAFVFYTIAFWNC